jgi:hypothetical protein
VWGCKGDRGAQRFKAVLAIRAVLYVCAIKSPPYLSAVRGTARMPSAPYSEKLNLVQVYLHFHKSS